MDGLVLGEKCGRSKSPGVRIIGGEAEMALPSDVVDEDEDEVSAEAVDCGD